VKLSQERKVVGKDRVDHGRFVLDDEVGLEEPLAVA
jgi:hypothetical protein